MQPIIRLIEDNVVCISPLNWVIQELASRVAVLIDNFLDDQLGECTVPSRRIQTSLRNSGGFFSRNLKKTLNTKRHPQKVKMTLTIL